MTDIYIVTGPDHINSIWKQSHLLRSDVYRQLVVYNMFGMPNDAAKFYLSDDSGTSSTPSQGSKIDPTQRVKYLTHRSLTKLLTGSGLKVFAESFATSLVQQFSLNEELTTEWSDLPDLFNFVRNELFKATVRAIYGDGILSTNPSFCEEFWEFDKGIASLAKRFPRWMVPSAYAARDRCLESVEAWHEAIRAPEGMSLTCESEFVKSRLGMWSKMERMSPQAMASEDLGVIWG